MSDDVAYLRFPHLYDDLLCFAAEDDLWVAPLVAEGHRPGRAWRITVDRTRVGHPRFSPDGRHIAYTNWRSLDPEIHLAPVDGGPARRLTYWGSTDTRVCSWDPDGNILAVSSHSQPFSYFSWAYKVATDGFPGRRLPWGPVSDIQVADIDGEHRSLLLTGKPPHEPAAWKRYRGGATGRLWLHGKRLLADLNGHLDCPMFVSGRIAFLSDHEGVGNLYSCLPDGTGLLRHTDHDAFYARHASSDGRRVVYQCAGELWIVDDLTTPGAVPRKLEVRLGGPRAGRRGYQVPAASHVDAISVDETGRASAVNVRGSLYWLTHRDGPARTIADTPGVRVRMPEMLGSAGQVAYVTDADAADAVEIAYLPRASGDREPRRLASGELGRVHELVSDPEGERIAIASHDGRLLLLDATEESADTARAEGSGAGEVTELIRSTNGPVRDLSFSPDGAWLTWSHPGIGRSLRQIKMARIADRTIVDVTNGRFEDENPVFTRDGRYLAFLSWRGFDPVYDVHTGDLSFPWAAAPISYRCPPRRLRRSRCRRTDGPRQADSIPWSTPAGSPPPRSPRRYGGDGRDRGPGEPGDAVPRDGLQVLRAPCGQRRRTCLAALADLRRARRDLRESGGHLRTSHPRALRHHQGPQDRTGRPSGLVRGERRRQQTGGRGRQ